MVWLLGAWVFWLALRGELGKYAGFVTTAGTGGGMPSIASMLGFGGSTGGLLGQAGGALTGTPGMGNNPATKPSQSGQPMPGTATVMSDNPPGTSRNAFGSLTAMQTEGAPIYSASSPALGYLTQAQGYVAGGAAGL